MAKDCFGFFSISPKNFFQSSSITLNISTGLLMSFRISSEVLNGLADFGLLIVLARTDDEISLSF